MKSSNFLSQVSVLETKLKIQKRWIGFFCFLVLFMFFTIMHLSNQKISVIYPQFASQKSYKVTTNAVTPHYLMDLARGDAMIFFSVDSTNVKYQTEEFLTRLMPSYYGIASSDFRQNANMIAKSNASYNFQISPKMTVTGDVVTLTGQRQTLVAGNIVDYGLLTVTITYYVSNGFVYIKNWDYNYESQKHSN